MLYVCTLPLFPLSCLVFAVFYWCEYPSSLCNWITDYCNLFFTAISHHNVALPWFPDGCPDLYHGKRFPRRLAIPTRILTVRWESGLQASSQSNLFTQVLSSIRINGVLYSCNQCTRPFCAVLPDGSLGHFHTPGAIAFSTELCAPIARFPCRSGRSPFLISVRLPVCCPVFSFPSSSLATFFDFMGRATFNVLHGFLPRVAFPLPPIARPVIMSSMHYFGCTESLFHVFPCLSTFVCDRQAHSLSLNEVPLLSQTCFQVHPPSFLFVVIGTLPFSQQGISPPSSFFAIAFRIQGCQCERKNEMTWCAN